MGVPRGASLWAQRIGIGVVVALVAVFALRVGSSSSQSVSFRDLTVWLPSTSTGEVVLAHAGTGTRGEVIARVKAASAGEALAVVQNGSSAVVLNRTKGEVGVVDGVTLTLSQRAPIAGVDEATQLVWSAAGTRVITQDTVHLLDKSTGVPAGSVPLEQPITGAVADRQGVVYGTTPAGSIVSVTSLAAPVAQADGTAPVGIVVAAGTAYVIDRTGPQLQRLEAGVVAGRACLSGPIAEGATVVAGGSGADEPPVAVVVDGGGGVRISDLDRNSCTSVALADAGSLGAPVVAGGLVYLPVRSTGEVIVLRAGEGTVLSRYSLGLAQGRAFELIEKDGTVWFNDPSGTSAGVLGRDAVALRIDKAAATIPVASGATGPGSGRTGGAGSGASGSGNSAVTGASGTKVSGPTGATGGSGASGADAGNGATPSGNGSTTFAPGAPGSDPNAAPSTPGARSGLVADFTYSTRSAKVGQAVTFTDTSSGTPSAWTWEFGDGTFATGAKVSHAWTQPGSYTVTLRVENATASASASVAITVIAESTKAKPEADFRFSSARVEVGQAVTFTDRSTGEPSAWQWSFGDGSGASGSSVSHVYATPGSYEVTLTATNSEGSDTSAPALITVFDKVDPPVAVIAGGLATANVGQQVGFFSRSSGNPTQFQWTFGDGTSANGAVVQHAWSKAGSYVVTLSVTNSAGSASATAAIVINDVTLQPESRFTVSQTTAEEGQSVRFQSLSTNTPTSLTWDFGDGAGASGTVVSHAYARAGSYTATLRAGNAAGSNVSTATITVVAQLPAPVAAFSFLPTSITTSTSAVFTDESSGGAAVSWSWDFGDGTPVVTQRNPTHRFERVGTYVVRLTVTNAKGSSEARRTVSVLPAAPEPQFTYSPAAPKAETPVQFTDTSGGGPGTSWLWNFGDGTTSTQRNPSKVFSANGSYDVRLTVTNASGSAFVVRRVDVDPPAPIAAFDFSPAAPTTATPVIFRNTSTGGEASVRWDFGDNTAPSTQRTPSHTYTAAGTYRVTLTMTNVSGTSQDVRNVVVTVPPPVAAFTNSSPLVAGAAVTFTNTSTGGPFTSISWDFDDGTAAATTANPVHVFAAAGPYDVRLTVTNGCCPVSVIRRVNVVAPITAAFSVGTPRVAGTAITFTNTTTGGPFSSISWDFGDGETATGATVAHTFGAAGTFPVTIRVTASSGAVDDHTTPVTVTPAAPVASFTYAAAASPARTVTFTNTSTGGPFTSVVWNFDDGSPTATGNTVTHTFAAGSSFDVQLTVNNGTAASVTRTVSMVAPVANFTFSNGTGTSVAFTSTSTGGPFVSLVWNFGDGTPTATGATVSHTFPDTGPYTVTLTAVNGAGSDDEAKPVTVT